MIGDILLWPLMAFGTAVSVVLGVALFAFWIWMIIDCANRKYKKDGEKIVWMILIILTTWIGALIYYFVVKISNPKGIIKR